MEDYPLSKLVKEIISTSDDSYELFLTRTKNLNSNEKKLLFEKLKLELNTDINLTQFVELEKQKGSKLSNELIATKFNQFRKISAIVDEYFNSIQYSIYESIYTQHLTKNEIENIKQLKKLPKKKRQYNVKEKTGFRTFKWNAHEKIIPMVLREIVL